MQLSQDQLQKIQQYFTKQQDVLLVYLYGSFAYGNPHKRSDLDFGVLFDKQQASFKKIGKIYSALCDFKLPAKPEVRDIGLDQSPVFLRNVIRGICVYSKDEITRIRFEVTVVNKFRDTRYLRIINERYAQQRLKEGTYGLRSSYTS